MFNPDLSYQLDAVVYLLERRPPLLVRLVLRWYKARLEMQLPL
jgi:hypothetical protein